MKHLKKLGSVLLALVMVMALAAPAFAADVDPAGDQMQTTENDPGTHGGTTPGNSGNTRGKITVLDAADGETYSIYRIFDLESYNRENGAYLYKINTAWNGFFYDESGKFDPVTVDADGNPVHGGAPFVTVDKDGYVSWDADVDTGVVQTFAQLALKYAKDHKLAPIQSKPGTGANLVFDNLDLGYYLVDSSMGALCNLNTTDSDVEIKEKNEVPTNDKEVEEDSTGKYGDKDDADIGQTVNFRSTIVAQAGAVDYVFHDKMDPGLSFDATSVSVTLNGTAVAAVGNYELVDYTADGAPEHAQGDECTFEIVFSDVFCDGLEADDKIVISYSAVLNEGAVVGVEGNENESGLTYGENGKTVFDKTTTYTWEMKIEKYAVNADGNEVNLADAKFTLSRATQDADGNPVAGDAIVFVKPDNQAETYRVATDAEKADASVTKYTEITTDETGEFKLIGLDADFYLLTETKAPDGYNELEGPILIQILGIDAPTTPVEGQDPVSDMGKVLTQDADGNPVLSDPVRVLNNSGTRLPSTGGIGTTIFYVVGGVLVLGAVVLLITKRRASADDE